MSAVFATIWIFRKQDCNDFLIIVLMIILIILRSTKYIHLQIRKNKKDNTKQNIFYVTINVFHVHLKYIYQKSKSFCILKCADFVYFSWILHRKTSIFLDLVTCLIVWVNHLVITLCYYPDLHLCTNQPSRRGKRKDY